ncbi:MAG: conjugative transposon protein TraN [Dysgonamonadaceae bacterium]|jgi:conjugative transposon TraN protein|nr:conjugative transposon protein TraN [Dysgonamonadaceae bacterium]
MKRTVILNVLLVLVNVLSAQVMNKSGEMKTISVNEQVSSHITIGEDIEYVDISTAKIVGDLPVKNILRIKPVNDSMQFKDGDILALITIVGERSKIQFNCTYTPDRNKAVSNVDVKTEDMASYVNVNVDMPKAQMRRLAWSIWNDGHKYFDVSREDYRLRITLNNIYTIKGYFFIDVSIRNKTNIEYDVDQIRFKIEDKKQTKATNFQQIEMEPVLSINEGDKFTKEYRNIYIFDKFTFPDEKVFTVEVAEKQVSGRTVILRIDYADILNADAFKRSLLF